MKNISAFAILILLISVSIHQTIAVEITQRIVSVFKQGGNKIYQYQVDLHNPSSDTYAGMSFYLVPSKYVLKYWNIVVIQREEMDADVPNSLVFVLPDYASTLKPNETFSFGFTASNDPNIKVRGRTILA
ncbi:hypothetical protein PPL_08468 [Heterostelium album PN500]|uniref:Carbohydrate binding domain-containing protein n=1 Tax=Heterostelium pallidum (strain ATCC 26659 / Pp 5 / PN500) TaxID=670386 RepID=D3BIA0_HETP5|nr:hypothetical protein PPL_08468 [Heterostelium album PN500]EFA79000.1 hypothetical protein PPL_08468 [Heterostelium album PN500]|eukprot:XP_020431124.1 hypothetical protein PPL_08468 [Heterostelium album PN500]